MTIWLQMVSHKISFIFIKEKILHLFTNAIIRGINVLFGYNKYSKYVLIYYNFQLPLIIHLNNLKYLHWKYTTMENRLKTTYKNK